MNRDELESVNQFLNRLPQDKINNLGQLETAKLFLWFSQKALGINHINLAEIEACFNRAHLALPTRLEYIMKKGYRIVQPVPNAFALERSEMHRFNEGYSQYLESTLPTVEVLKEQSKIESPPFLTEDEITDGYRMMPAYLMLRFVENSARKWIAKEMDSILGDNWLKSFIDSPKLTLGQKQDLKNIFGKSQFTVVSKHNKLINSEDSLLSYVDWGDLRPLVNILFNLLERAGWESKTLNQIRNCLLELNDFRDQIAHCRTIPVQNMSSLVTRSNEWCSLLKT